MGPPVLMSQSQYREWPLPGAERVIACRWHQRIAGDWPPGPAGPGYVQRVLPDGCADVIVIDGERSVVVGPTAAVALPELVPGTFVVGLRVRTEAIRAMFGVPGFELRDRSVALDEVLEPGLARRVTKALVAPGGEGDAWLAGWAATAPVDRRAADAVQQLLGRSGVDVATVAESVGVSCRQLRRVVESQSGLGPKTLQRIGRLQRFLSLAEGAVRGPRTGRPHRGLADWAAEAGYADQAHLARDVGELAATTPSLLLAERGATTDGAAGGRAGGLPTSRR